MPTAVLPRIACLSLLALSLTTSAVAQQPLDAAGIAKAIAELGHDEYAVREAASKKLWLAGTASEAALRKAVTSPDAEVRQRARVILEKFDLGLTPDMPPEFELLVTSFKQSDANGKQTILRELITQKKIKTALQLARGEKEAAIRTSLLTQASLQAQRYLPELLVSEEIDEAESILEAIDQTDTTLERLTAILLITGRLKDRLKQTEEKLAAATSPALAKRAIYFRRAAGDLAGAADLAGKNQLVTYQRAILLEQGDWKAAAALQQTILKDSLPSIEAAGYGAALHFFAGNQTEAEQLLTSVRTRATEQVSAYWDAAEAHLVCEKPEQALDLLEKSVPGAASYIHALRLDYARSQAIAGVTKDTRFDKAWYNTLVDGGLVATQMRVPRPHFARDLARQLYLLGERERAKEIVAVLREIAREDKSGPWWPTLLQADIFLNDRPQALRDLQEALGRPGISQSQLFGALYSKDFILAEALYTKLGTAGEKRAESLATIEKLFGPGGFTDEEGKKLLSEFDVVISPWLAAADFRQHIRGGEILLRLGDRAWARKWFERAAISTTDGYISLGDLAREDADWASAIKWYRLACDKLPGLPLPRYLLGHSLIQAGQLDEGKREVRKASLTALAPVTRYALAYQLKERGLIREAAEQALILQQTANPTVQHPTLAAGHLRANAIMDELPAQAADGWQRWLLSQLSGVNNYTLFDHYLADPELIHRQRARIHLKAGNAPAAVTELRRVQLIMPGNVRMLEEFVPLLEKAGHDKDAAGLLSFAVDKYEQVIRDYPKTSFHRRELALLFARCNRRLDDALALIQTANKFEPQTAANLDALAEIHFLRGEQAAAIAAGEQALALEKRNPEFITRLARWRAKK